MAQSFVLKQITPTQQEFTIPMDGLRIGRTPDNGVQLNDDVVSRHHATVWAQGDQVYIRDEGTTNGTFVKGQRLTANTPQVVNIGDEIKIGPATFELATVVAPVVVAAAVAAASSPVRSSSNMLYLLGGGVLAGIALIALFISLASTTPHPALPITLTPVPSATIPPAPPTPVAPSVSPTALPTTASTAPQLVQPNAPKRVISLIEPSNGAVFSGGGTYILLRWQDSQPLAAGQSYHVTIDCDRRVGIAPEEAFVTAPPQWQVPAHVYDPMVDPRQCRWTVSVVDSAKNVIATGTTGTFKWEKEDGHSGTSPVVTPTMGK